MAIGNVYFAWVDPGETVFGPEHQRYDENVFSFRFEHTEGDFATLDVEIKRPRNVGGGSIGLLAPGRKIWAWFAFDCGTGLLKFFGRLVGVTSNVLLEVVAIRFIARPSDYAAQKAALADTLRTLPNYDPIFVDEARRADPDVVLEGYSAAWHVNPETHAVTVSDILIGEDPIVELAATDMDFQGLDMAPQGVPLTSVTVNAELTWTQLAKGTINLTDYLVETWPNEGISGGPGSDCITSFTFNADNWPQAGAGLGDGWEVAEATCVGAYNVEVNNKTEASKVTHKWWDGGTTTIESSLSSSELIETPPGSIDFANIITQDQMQSKLGDDGEGGQQIVSWSRNASWTDAILPLLWSRPTLVAAYESEREFTELVTFQLTADMQPLLTEPGEDEALRIDDLRSVNLSEAIDGTIPIGDARRRSYITQDRGLQSLQYMIAVARAHLRKRSRAVEITVAPRVGRFPEISLRKSARVHDPRLPGGVADGKIIGYALALNGDDGQLERSLRIGCPIGRGGAVTIAPGTPLYVEEGYVNSGYQAYSGQTVLFDSSVGYTPPVFNPADDGIDFLSELAVADVLDQPLTVTFPPAVQRDAIEAIAGAWGVPQWFGTDQEAAQEALQEEIRARAESVNAVLKDHETRATFKLKSMRREFESPYPVTVTELKIPTGFNLEAA